MREGLQPDFFVSYNLHDRAWAEWIAWQVEASGYTAVIQVWDFRPGSNFVLQLHGALAQAKRVLLVLSKNFLTSEFTQPEWAAAFASDPKGSERKIVPIRVEECSPTGLLKAIIYIDLVGRDEDAAREELLSGLKSGRIKPSLPPKFPYIPGPDFPPVSRGDEPEETHRTRFSLVLSGTIDSMNRPTVEAILEHIKKFASDASITLVEVKSGSVILIFEGSLEGVGRLHELVNAGELKTVSGHRLEGFDFGSFEQLRRSRLDSLVKSSLNKLVLHASRLLRNERWSAALDAEDLVSEAYLKVYRYLRFSDRISEGRFIGLMRVAMRSFLIDFARASAGAKRGGGISDEWALPVAESELLPELSRAIDRIEKEDPRTAEIIWLRYIDGLTIKEIVDLTGLTRSQVFNLKQKGINRLKAYFQSE
jgi:RNA polymerase sigma factor (sigma-70 family)